MAGGLQQQRQATKTNEAEASMPGEPEASSAPNPPYRLARAANSAVIGVTFRRERFRCST